MAPKKKTPQSELQPSHQIIMLGLTTFQSAVEAVGLPGAIFACMFFLLVAFGTADQKHAAIDLFILGRGVGQATPLLLYGILYVFTVLGLRKYYDRQRKADRAEIERLADWKRHHQTEQADVPLHRSKGAGKKD